MFNFRKKMQKEIAKQESENQIELAIRNAQIVRKIINAMAEDKITIYASTEMLSDLKRLLPRITRIVNTSECEKLEFIEEERIKRVMLHKEPDLLMVEGTALKIIGIIRGYELSLSEMNQVIEQIMGIEIRLRTAHELNEIKTEFIRILS